MSREFFLFMSSVVDPDLNWAKIHDPQRCFYPNVFFSVFARPSFSEMEPVLGQRLTLIHRIGIRQKGKQRSSLLVGGQTYLNAALAIYRQGKRRRKVIGRISILGGWFVVV